MYQITYQKRNGVLFDRIRNTIPGKVGQTTSMGWIIMDIKYSWGNKYYSYEDYKRILHRSSNKRRTLRRIDKFIRRYCTTLILVVLVPMYIFK